MGELMKIDIINCSIVEGEPVEFEISEINSFNSDHFSYNISIVNEDYTSFILASGGNPKIEEDRVLISCPQVSELEVGLYILTHLSLYNEVIGNDPSITTQQDIINLTSNDFGICLFEIRKSIDPCKTLLDLENRYKKILIEREKKFHSGIGSNLNDKAREYEGYAFLKNCFINEKMRIGQCELIPAGALSWIDEINHIQSFIKNHTFMNLNEILFHAEQSQPVTVVYFPKIFACSHKSSIDIIQKELEPLQLILTLSGSGYSSIFSIIVIDILTGKSFDTFTFPLNSSKRFLLGGANPTFINKKFNKLKYSPQIKLYFTLFREAIVEENIEFRYLRLWNILETIAQSKKYTNLPKRNWNGNIIKKSGRIEHIKDQVYELMRETLQPHGFTENIIHIIDSRISSLKQENAGSLVSIWYQHRNCMVHQGGCFPSNPKYCNKSSCKAAHNEIVSKFGVRDISSDYHLVILEETVKSILGIISNK